MTFEEHVTNLDKFEEDLVTNFSDCTFQCVQRCFVFIHIVLGLTAILIFTIGVLLYLNTDDVVLDYIQETELKGFFNAAIFLTALGAVTFILPFLACIGTRKYNFKFLVGYLILLVIVLAMESASAVVSWIYRAQITDVHNIFMNSMHKYGESGFEKHTSTLNSIQRQHTCCGSKTHEDWYLTKWGKNNNGSLPVSCCPQADMKFCDVDDLLTLEAASKLGCYVHIEKFLQENLHLISGFSIWIIVLNILGICFLIAFLIQIRQRQKLRLQDEITELYTMKEF